MGEALVDTQFSRSMGFEGAEVQRGCFCGRFNDLLVSARGLVADHRPDYIIAEPVGSCTDLQATAVPPLQTIYGEEFDVAPLMILVDAKALQEAAPDPETLNGYLRKHQIEEADIVVLSKIDKVPTKELSRLQEVIRSLNPRVTVIPSSAITNDGLKEVLEVVQSKCRSDHIPVNIDYDRCAAAEAERGWFNGTFRFTLPARTD
jgi:G3E family GTPase